MVMEPSVQKISICYAFAKPDKPQRTVDQIEVTSASVKPFHLLADVDAAGRGQALDMLTEAAQKMNGRLQSPSATWHRSIIRAMAAGIHGILPCFVCCSGRPFRRALLTSIA